MAIASGILALIALFFSACALKWLNQVEKDVLKTFSLMKQIDDNLGKVMLVPSTTTTGLVTPVESTTIDYDNDSIPLGKSTWTYQLTMGKSGDRITKKVASNKKKATTKKKQKRRTR